MTIKAKCKSGLAHCCHHGEHWEFCSDFDKRVEYIKNNKPQEEQELRLKLFQLIPYEILPGKGSDEWKAFNKTWEARDEAREARDKARVAYDKAWEAYNKAGIAINKTWVAYDKAWKARNEAREAYEKAMEACDKAGIACEKAWGDYEQARGKELAELHDEMFPDCPWDGHTIFKG